MEQNRFAESNSNILTARWTNSVGEMHLEFCLDNDIVLFNFHQLADMPGQWGNVCTCLIGHS